MEREREQVWTSGIESELQGWLDSARTPGAAVSLIRDGEPPVSTCAGVQDAGGRRAITPTTMFEAASLSKPLFAHVVVQLADKGALSLDVPLHDLLAQDLITDEPRLERLTARQVLSHSSGLPNWLDKVDQPTMLFAPGEGFGYSGEAYVYLQRVMEVITGKDLETLARDLVFAPLGMTRSSFRLPTALVADLALGHTAEGSPRSERPPLEDNAAASLYTTLEDYSRFLAEMVSRTTGPWGEAMIDPQNRIDSRTAWGLGWGLKLVSGEWLFWQWGDNTGYKHVAAGSPSRGEAVCVFTNGDGGHEVWKRVLLLTLDPEGELHELSSHL